MVSDMTAKEYKKLVDLKLSEFFNPSGLSYFLNQCITALQPAASAYGRRLFLSFAVSQAETLKKPFLLRAQ